MEERIVELEIKVAYQEKTLGELHEVVLGQQREIERLEKRLGAMERRLAEGEAEPPVDEPPPHY